MTVIAFIIGFYKPVRALLDRLAAKLTVETVTLKAFGAESNSLRSSRSVP